MEVNGKRHEMRDRFLDHQRGAREALAGHAMVSPQPDRRCLLHRRLGQGLQDGARVERRRAFRAAEGLGRVARTQAGPRPLEEAG